MVKQNVVCLPMEIYSAKQRHDLLIHTATWMKPQNIILCERNKTHIIYNPLILKIQKRQISRDTKYIGGCLGAEGGIEDGLQIDVRNLSGVMETF